MSDARPNQAYDTSLVYTSSRTPRVAVGLIVLYATLRFLGSPLVPPVYTVQTEEVLPAGLETSWQVLQDFSSYPLWNPYLTSIEGEFEEGQKLVLTLVAGPGIAPRESHSVMADIDPGKYFAWQGQQFPLPGISHTRHVFAIEGVEHGHTLLRHYEEFRGLAVAFDTSDREAQVKQNKAAFTRMNSALKARLAQMQGH